ncbi:hypothetical protein HK105_208613 [Polyrhizophydium stewartii]|uniref:BHLH domain-containing protein n=1 Tax=Polyrhizophydium stewartii TaxID=2732419 RepID=A0ABR4MX92_9FUNG
MQTGPPTAAGLDGGSPAAAIAAAVIAAAHDLRQDPPASVMLRSAARAPWVKHEADESLCVVPWDEVLAGTWPPELLEPAAAPHSLPGSPGSSASSSSLLDSEEDGIFENASLASDDSEFDPDGESDPSDVAELESSSADGDRRASLASISSPSISRPASAPASVDDNDGGPSQSTSPTAEQERLERRRQANKRFKERKKLRRRLEEIRVLFRALPASDPKHADQRTELGRERNRIRYHLKRLNMTAAIAQQREADRIKVRERKKKAAAEARAAARAEELAAMTPEMLLRRQKRAEYRRAWVQRKKAEAAAKKAQEQAAADAAASAAGSVPL